MTKITLFYDRVRWEEKQLHARASERGIPLDLVDVRGLLYQIPRERDLPGIALQRCVSHTRGIRAAQYFELGGTTVINASRVSEICGDKFATGLRLLGAGIPHPRTAEAFSVESALQGADKLGYPIVMKPLNGSWGREVAVLSDARSLKSYLELKEGSGDPDDHVYYLQEFIQNPGRDIRTVCVGGEVVASIYRYAPEGDWRSNVALGGTAKPCQLDREGRELMLKAAEVVGGEIVGVDSMEGPQGLMVHEVNSNVEFRGAAGGTGVDIAGRILDYALRKAAK
ncbi:MAG: lysine biosynthesis protein LysX [Conexivisphaerales archaeon]|jgi:[lysine-biosynthesis-protein LysW]--L-2-aminoadipate ligase